MAENCDLAGAQCSPFKSLKSTEVCRLPYSVLKHLQHGTQLGSQVLAGVCRKKSEKKNILCQNK